MATVSPWNPFGVALEISATAASVTRTSATQYKVKINASWETYYNGANTNYGMTASSGGGSVTLNPFGTYSSGDLNKFYSFEGTYSISGNGSATKTITVTFKNFNSDNGKSATKDVQFDVTVPALASYKVTYNANGGSGAPSAQTKWKDQDLTLSSTKPTRTGYSFQGWATSASGSVTYAAGAKYTANAAVTLYAKWKANTYTVSFNANGGIGAPGNQTKTYGVNLTLSSTKPTRTNYNFLGWGLSAAATDVAYTAGGSYTNNAAITLYAVWELAYIKPKVTNLSIARCDANGNITDDGTYAKIAFDWSTYMQATEIEIECDNSDIPYNKVLYYTISGNSGSFSQVVCNGELSTESSFNIYVNVADTVGYTSVSRVLGSLAYPIDVLAKGLGIAFGKAANLEGVADFAYEAKFNKPVYGKALGMDRLPAIPENSDFNYYLEPGCYAVQSNAIAGTCANIPIARAGRLEVWSATGEGVRQEQWSYLRQRFIPYNSSNAVWERELTRGEDNVWNYFDWWKSSLTPDASEKVYSKAAMTISLSNNTTLGVVNTYTPIPFDKTVLTTSDRLTLSNNSICIGANIDYVKVSGQTLVKFGSTAGSKHARIQKISGGTTTSIAWTCIYGTAASNTVFPLTPVIVPVSEGDLIRMVYYTGDADDTNTSGSSGNGWQTFLTVEEL